MPRFLWHRLDACRQRLIDNRRNSPISCRYSARTGSAAQASAVPATSGADLTEDANMVVRTQWRIGMASRSAGQQACKFPDPRHQVPVRAKIRSLVATEQGIACNALRSRFESSSGCAKAAQQRRKSAKVPDVFPVGREIRRCALPRRCHQTAPLTPQAARSPAPPPAPPPALVQPSPAA
jgi:hypothetical protein